MSSARFIVTLLAAAAVAQVPGEWSPRNAALAQSFGENPESFPIPSSLPDGTTLKVDGSTSMQLTNEELESRFEEQFSNVDVQLAASRTDEAIEALVAGAIDVVAAGRPLTEEERAQGLAETAIPREKLAILLGPENTFEGDLTFEQFAQVFRGEITNWSEIGGPDLAIRLIDRPNYSDTRRALGTYTVFDGKPFETGNTADPVAEDETSAVVAALGADGIGYAVVSQVIDRDDVRIIPMHKTLPDDSRYPYSQHRAFVYKEDASPAVLAFLGFATTSPGQEVIVEEAPTATTATDEPVAPDAATVPDAAEPETVEPDAVESEAVESETVAPPPESSEPAEESTTALVPDAAPTGEADGGGLPWWLIGIPILGGLLWWFLKGRGGGAPAAAPAPVTTAPVPGSSAAIGATAAAATGAAVAAGAVAATGAVVDPRMVLTPRNSQDAYAYWEIPSDRLAAAKQQGGEKMKLRLYDVTDRLPDASLPAHAAEFDCVEADPDLHLSIPQSDRDYVAEVGYLTGDDHWLPITQSNSVRVPAAFQEVTSNGLKVPGVALGGAAVAAAGTAALGAAALLKKSPKAASDSPAEAPRRMVLTPRNAEKAYAYWEVPDTAKTALKAEGGQDCQLLICDVTGIDLQQQSPHSVLTYDVAETDCDRFVRLPDVNRDYMAKVGYRTEEGTWLELARSAPIRAATILESTVDLESAADQPQLPNLGAIAGGAVAMAGGAAAVAAAGNAAATADDDKEPARQSVKAKIELLPQANSNAYATWAVPNVAKMAAKQHGGQQYQLRLYDVTGINLDTQVPHRAQKYACDEASESLSVSVPQADRDYLAEIGYEAPGNRWLRLARSTPVRIPASNGNVGSAGIVDPAAALGIAAAGVAGAAMATTGVTASTPTETTTASTPTEACAIETVKVHSRHHAVLLDESQMRHIQDSVATTYRLEPGLNILCIREGAFNYGGGGADPGEPFVLLWIYGGIVVNQKTGVPVSSTWSTLNGYADTLTLQVREPATLCAFFFDTYPDDNLDEVTLSIVQI
ncbi:MAG: DUF4912 domain-containing protein [Cyanobacteria bacterium J06639_14]